MEEITDVKEIQIRMTRLKFNGINFRKWSL
jgi:hypothetical protein